MAKHKFKELSSCVRGERFKYTFSGVCEQYVALLTESEYEKYKQDYTSVERKLVSSPFVLISNSDDDKLVAVIDLGGKDFPKGWSGSVKRYSPVVPVADIDKSPSIFNNLRVKNAKDTEADESMIQYWKDNKDKNSKIDLSKRTFRCPSCGKTVKVEELDGAHVIPASGSSQTLYITPTCRTCNRSKVDRIFEVNNADLVKAPNK